MIVDSPNHRGSLLQRRTPALDEVVVPPLGVLDNIVGEVKQRQAVVDLDPLEHRQPRRDDLLVVLPVVQAPVTTVIDALLGVLQRRQLLLEQDRVELDVRLDGRHRQPCGIRLQRLLLLHDDTNSCKISRWQVRASIAQQTQV